VCGRGHIGSTKQPTEFGLAHRWDRRSGCGSAPRPSLGAIGPGIVITRARSEHSHQRHDEHRRHHRHSATSD